MNRILPAIAPAAALVVGAVWLSLLASGAADDEAALKAQTSAFVAAWGRHDPKALAAFWSEDGDLVTPRGRVSKGRAEIEKGFVDEMTGDGRLRESTYEVKADSVRFAGPDVAVQDWEVVITGVYGPDGRKAGAQEYHVTTVAVRRGDLWLKFAARPYLKPPPETAENPATGPVR